MTNLLLCGCSAEIEDQAMQARHCCAGDVSKPSRDAGLQLGERLQARAGVARDDGTVEDCLDRKVMLAAHAKAEKIAGEEQVDDLPSAICSRRKPPGDTGFNPVPILYKSIFL